MGEVIYSVTRDSRGILARPFKMDSAELFTIEKESDVCNFVESGGIHGSRRPKTPCMNYSYIILAGT